MLGTATRSWPTRDAGTDREGRTHDVQPSCGPPLVIVGGRRGALATSRPEFASHPLVKRGLSDVGLLHACRSVSGWLRQQPRNLRQGFAQDPRGGSKTAQVSAVEWAYLHRLGESSTESKEAEQ